MMAIAAVSAALLAQASAPAPPITALAFAPGDREIIVGSQAGLEVRSWPSMTVKRKLDSQLSHVHDLAFAPNGEILAVGGGEPKDSGAIETFSWPAGSLLKTLEQTHADVVTAIAIEPSNPTAGRIASVGADAVLILQDLTSGLESRRLQGHSKGATGVAFIDSDTLISASLDQSLRVWSLKTNAVVRGLTNHTQKIRALAIRPGARPGPPMAATAGADRTVRFWQPTIGRLVRMIKLDREPLAIAWSRDGSTIAASCTDGRARIVDPDSATLIQDEAAIEGWAYSIAAGPNGGFLVGGENGRLAWVPRTVPATVHKAFRDQTDLIQQAEHCSVSPSLLKILGIQVGQQIRVAREGGYPALFTVSQVRDQDADSAIIRIGQSGRARLGTIGGDPKPGSDNNAEDGFTVRLSAMGPRPGLSDAEARARGECVERWIDFDPDAQAIALAPHGGGIELETDRQAERFVKQLREHGQVASAWICLGFRAPGGDRSASSRWHITSTDLHEISYPELGRLRGRTFTHAVSFHGMTGQGILIGGAAPESVKRAFQTEIEKAVQGTGWPVRIAGPQDRLRGESPANIVNRYAPGRGVQIEQSSDARRQRGQAIADAAARACRSLP